MPVSPPTDEHVRAVAEAMDVDNKLDWSSAEHDKIAECLDALDEARRMIIGVNAVMGVHASNSATMIYNAMKVTGDRHMSKELPPLHETVPFADRDPIPSD